MKNQDHHISKAIVQFALENKVKVIKLEDLSSIKNERREEVYYTKERKRVLKSWSYGRLIQYIQYKAQKEGIEVQFVDPSYTSQICPMCGDITKINMKRTRRYRCNNCDFQDHVDKIAACNILYSEPKKKKSNKKEPALV